eukprot:s963_g42.t1
MEKRATLNESKKKVKRRTVTMNFQSAGEPSNLPPASWERVNSACPSVQDALDRYYMNTGFIPAHELGRMRIAFQRFSEENDLYRGQVHEVLTHLCYVPVSEDKATAIAKDTNEFSTLDFQDFCDFCERYQNYEREVVRVKIEEWMSREKDEDYEPDAVTEVQGFLKSMGIISLKDAVEEILELGGLKDYTCTKPEDWGEGGTSLRPPLFFSLRPPFFFSLRPPVQPHGMTGQHGTFELRNIANFKYCDDPLADAFVGLDPQMYEPGPREAADGRRSSDASLALSGGLGTNALDVACASPQGTGQDY